MELTPAEKLAHSTVRIECDLPSGETSYGTGFFYALNIRDNTSIPVIVTNKHVIQGSTVGRFTVTLQNSADGPAVGNYQTCHVDSFEKCWVPHPDLNVDLCAMPIASILDTAKENNSAIFAQPMDKSFIPNAADVDDMIGLETITMVGYPNGIWDQKNNLPVFRKGTLATNYKYDWNGKKEFLIDMACFPGSSGSPVLLFDIGAYQSRSGYKLGSTRIKLLGILHAGPQHTVEGEISIVPVPTHKKAVSVANIPNNLGIVIKSEVMEGFETHFGSK